MVIDKKRVKVLEALEPALIDYVLTKAEAKEVLIETSILIQRIQNEKDKNEA